MSWRLRTQQGEELELADGDHTVGRSGGCDIATPEQDLMVSRLHARLRVTGDTLEVEDSGSLNGTWVNGERIEESAVLRPGDSLRVGETCFEAVWLPAEPEPAEDADEQPASEVAHGEGERAPA